MTTNIAGSPDLSFGNNGTVWFSDLQGVSGLLKDGSTVTAAPATINGSYYIGVTKHDVHGVRSYAPVYSGSAKAVGVHTVAVQPDDKLLLLGSFKDDTSAFIARFNGDGKIDADFGPGGSKKLNANLYASVNSKFGLAVQDDAKILAGFATDLQHSEIWRLEADGQLDLGFGVSGQLKLSGIRLRDLVTSRKGFVISGMKDDQAIIASYLANGQPDPDFGVNGLVTLVFEQYPRERAIAVGLARSRDHKTVVVGTSYTVPHAFNFIARLLEDGTADPQFNGAKPVETDTDHGAYTSVVMQGDDKAVVLARNDIGSVVQLLRYMPDSQLDSGFGTDGVALAYRDPQGRPELALVNKLEVLLPDEKLQTSGSPRGASYLGRILSR